MSTNTRSEHLDSNGHTNGHHGKPKVFELAPVKTPEEAERELVKEIAPKIRRYVRSDGALSGGAKFFFDALLDDSFMFSLGGTGRGILYVSVKDLAERYKHDKKTIRTWRDELVKRRWLWFNPGWPFPEWRITNLCPAPEGKSETAAVQMMLGKAEAGRRGEGKVSPGGGEEGIPPESPINPPEEGILSPRAGEKTDSQSPISPLAKSDLAPGSRGEIGPVGGKDRTLRGETYGRREGKVSPARGESLPSKTAIGAHPPTPGAGLEKSPELGRSGDSKKRGSEAPPSTGVDPEKVFWNGRHWWISQLHKQLDLLNREMARADPGAARREVTAKRHTLLVALGIRNEQDKPKPSQVERVATVKLPPKEQWEKYVRDLREAAR